MCSERGKQGGPPSKAKYPDRPIANQYREGKSEKHPGEGSEIEPETVRPQAVGGGDPDGVLFVERTGESVPVARLRGVYPEP